MFAVQKLTMCYCLGVMWVLSECFLKALLWLKASHLMPVWLWAPASPSALHPLECNFSASALWGKKSRVMRVYFRGRTEDRDAKLTWSVTKDLTLSPFQEVAVQPNIYHQRLRSIKGHLQTQHSCTFSVQRRLGIMSLFIPMNTSD